MTEDYKETAESKGNSPKDQLSTRNVGALFFGIPSDCCSFSAPASIMKFSSQSQLAFRMSRRKRNNFTSTWKFLICDCGKSLVLGARSVLPLWCMSAGQKMSWALRHAQVSQVQYQSVHHLVSCCLILKIAVNMKKLEGNLEQIQEDKYSQEFSMKNIVPSLFGLFLPVVCYFHNPLCQYDLTDLLHSQVSTAT